MEKIRAWLPQFETACQRSAAVKAEISATDSVDQKMQIKKAKLDPVNQKLGELQKELKALLKELSDAERADVQSQVQKILTQYGVS